MTGKLKQLALIATLVTSGAVSVDATIYDGTELSPREIRMEKRAEKIDVKQENNTVEASLPWVDQPGIKIKYNLGEITAKERLLDRRNQEALIDNTSFGEGGVKFDIILNEKPSTNQFCYTVEGAENYAFAYQGALTAKEIADGAVRPDNIVGSYAVYHKSLVNNQYKTGKAFHIERPKVWSLSNDKNKQLATLSYSEGQLCVTAPQAFLDTADYPVRIDPTLGYSSAGASIISMAANELRVSLVNAQYQSGGTATSVVAYASSTVSSSLKGLIFSKENNSSTVNVVTGASSTGSVVTTAAWYTFSFPSSVYLATSTSIAGYVNLPGVVSSGALGLYYDSAASTAYNHYASTTYSYSGTPNSTTLTTRGTSMLSIYYNMSPQGVCDWQTTTCAESVVDFSPLSLEQNQPGNEVVWTSTSTVYVFSRGTGNNLEVSSSTDYGKTWSGNKVVDSVNTTDVAAFSVWYDCWTATTTCGRYIHVATLDTSVDDTYYTRLDIVNNTISTTVLGTTQGGSAASGVNYAAITQAENGDLFMASAATADSWVVKCAATSTCTTASNWYEPSPSGGFYAQKGEDVPVLAPIGGTNNILLVYKDISADTINYNVWSATSSSWQFSATTTIVSTIEDNTTTEGGGSLKLLHRTSSSTYLLYVDGANDLTTADHDLVLYKHSSTTGWQSVATILTARRLATIHLGYSSVSTCMYVLVDAPETSVTSTGVLIPYKNCGDLASSTLWSRHPDLSSNLFGLTYRPQAAWSFVGMAPFMYGHVGAKYKSHGVLSNDLLYYKNFYVETSTPPAGDSPAVLREEEIYFLQ